MTLRQKERTTSTSGDMPSKYFVNDDLVIGVLDGYRVGTFGKLADGRVFYCAHPKCSEAAKYFDDAGKFKLYAKLAAGQPSLMRKLVEEVTGMSYQQYLDSL